jgi:peptidoglycan/LPS O-acetylase OafA/YrhL
MAGGVDVGVVAAGAAAGAAAVDPDHCAWPCRLDTSESQTLAHPVLENRTVLIMHTVAVVAVAAAAVAVAVVPASAGSKAPADYAVVTWIVTVIAVDGVVAGSEVEWQVASKSNSKFTPDRS